MILSNFLFHECRYGINPFTILFTLSLFACLCSLLLTKGFNHPEKLGSGKNDGKILDIHFPLSLIIATDFVLNMVFSSNNPIFIRSRLSRGILLLALIFPISQMLLVGIPTRNMNLIVFMFYVSGLLATYAVLLNLYEFGGSMFQNNLNVISGSLNILSYPVIGLSHHKNIPTQVLYVAYFSLLATALLIYLVLSIQWLKLLIKKPFNEITSGEYSCLVHLLMSGSVIITFNACAIYFRQLLTSDSPPIMLLLCSCLTILFIVVLNILDGRILNREMYIQQETLGKKRLFVRYISHEIRTPLNTVFVGLEVLRKELISLQLESEALETVDEVRDSCQTALEVLNNLLDYEKLDAGLMKLDDCLMDAAPFFNAAVRPFFLQAREAGISLDFEEFSSAIIRTQIQIDNNKLSQVVRNFLSNALKFTPRNGSVTVSLSVVSPAQTRSQVLPRDQYGSRELKQYLQLMVKDTGAGISKDDISKVFKEVVQFSPGKLQNGGGSGLGLWISKRIVDLHGGGVAVFSEGEGSGCTFIMEIPCWQRADTPVMTGNANMSATTDAKIVSVVTRVSSLLSSPASTVSEPKIYPATSKKLPPSLQGLEEKSHQVDRDDDNLVDLLITGADQEDQAPPVRSTLKDLCVLVVDDSSSNRKMLARGLRASEISNILQAEDGEAATVAVKQSLANPISEQRIDVILMDYQMPKLDGPSATRAIRDMGYEGLIVGITGNALPEDKSFFISHGANAVFSKPVVMSELLDWIEHWWTEHPQVQAPNLILSSITADLIETNGQ